GESIFFSKTPFPSLSISRYFRTKSVSNCNSREKMRLGLGNIKGLNDALHLYENMSRMRPLPSVIQFTQLLSRVVNLKEYSAAIYLFKDICNLGVPVNEYTMNVAINCYCLSDRADYGFSILGWFFKRGCVPNVITFNTLLKGLFRESKINEAQELPRVMEKGRGCKPSTHIYNMVIDSLCKDKMIDSALKLFDEMSEKDITPNIVTYNALICGLCNFSRWWDAKINVFDSMASMNIAPDVRSYSILINGYCKKKKIDEAMHMFREMPRKGLLKSNIVTYNTVLQGLFRGGRCSEALEIFEELQAVGFKPDFYTYCNMLDGLCRNEGFSPDSFTLELLLDSLYVKEHNSTVFKMFQKWAPSTLNKIQRAKELGV
ncbi:pentatricopeptide repeat-containing protein at1g62680 mitochondrial, partial [Phtheirospermum japonicum]